jgi:hypothetical protein
MVFAAMVMFAFTAFAQTTISVQVSVAEDDCEEQLEADGENPANYMDHGSSDLELCTESEGIHQVVGIGFRNVTIPPGATITNAYIQFSCDDFNDDVIELEGWGVAEANTALPIGTDPGSVTSRPKTTAQLTGWSPAPWTAEMEHTKDAAQQSPDISAIVQEIVNIAGWASGNNMMICFTDDQTVKAHREAESYDGDPAEAPTLVVTFTEGTGINTLSDELSGIVYPNPAEGIVNISNPSSDNFSYEIFNINGQLVASRYNLSGASTELDMSAFAKGMYFVDVTTSERTQTLKLILQ